MTHAYFRDLLRLMAFCRLSHVWVEGTSWNTPMRRHPEMAWQDVLTADQAKELVTFATRQFLSMDGSLGWNWVYYDYKRLTISTFDVHDVLDFRQTDAAFIAPEVHRWLGKSGACSSTARSSGARRTTRGTARTP